MKAGINWLTLVVLFGLTAQAWSRPVIQFTVYQKCHERAAVQIKAGRRSYNYVYYHNGDGPMVFYMGLPSRQSRKYVKYVMLFHYYKSLSRFCALYNCKPMIRRIPMGRGICYPKT